MERKTLLKTGLVTFVLADMFLNGMNAAVFASGDGWQYYLSLGAFLLLAFAFAIAAPIIGFHGDATAQNKAFIAAMLSAALSVMSVYTAINTKSQLSVDIVEQRQRLELELASKDQKIADCSVNRFCVSETMREDYRQKEQQLAALPAGTYAIDRHSLEHRLKLAMFVLIALLCPFVSSEFSRQLGFKTGSVGDKSGSHGAPARNLPELIKTKQVSRASVPTDQDHEKLKKAYRGMMIRKQKVTVAGLAKNAGIRKAVAGWWLKNTDMETMFEARDLVPVSKPRLSVVD